MIATNNYALIDPDKRVGTVTRVGASSVELTVPLGLAISGQRGSLEVLQVTFFY